MTQQIVYAIHNFEAENEDEINFSAGEPIVVLERDDKYMDGWWQGRNVHGHVGLFPMNYVSPEKPQRITKASTTASSSYYSPSPSSTTSLNKTSHSEYSTLEEKINNAISHVQSATSISARPEDWDTSMVASWLESAGLGSVGHIFVEQEISGDILLNLTMDSLKELGISTFGKRYKIMQAIGDLKAERREEPKSRAHGGSRHFSTATPPSPVESDKSYHTPRYNNHASSTDISVDDGNQYFLAPTARNQHPSAESMRPISPQSLSSPNVSRSNTLNTMSSRKSSSSTGTHRSEERIPSLPKSKTTSTFSPPSQRNGPTNDAMNKSATVSSAPSGVSHSQWANDSNISIGTADFTHPMENGQRKLSVASVDHQQQAAQESQAPEHEGWLHKQSDKYKTWNKRWFVLKGTNLFYFKSPKDVRMKGIINLRGYRIIVDDSIHSGKYCFKAQHEHERTFFFYTDTEDSMRKWINVLMKTTIARDISTPVMSSNPVATVSLEVARKMRPRPPSMIMYKGQQQQRPATNLAVPSESLSMLQEEVDDEQQVSNSANAYTDDSSSYADVRPQNSSNAVWDRSDYVDWVNQHIETRRIDNLTTSFRDGQVLIELLENLSNKTVRRPLEPDNDDENAVNMHMLDTIVAAFKFMGREGVAIDGNFTIKDIFAGNEDKIIHMLDALRKWAEGTDVAMPRAEMTTSVF